MADATFVAMTFAATVLGSQQAPGEPEPGWLEVAQGAAELARYGWAVG